MNRDGGPVAAQSQLNPTPCLLSPLVASAGKQPRNQAPNQTCVHRRTGGRARGGCRLANQVLNGVILRVPKPLCLAEICSLFKTFGYVFEIVVPPHGHWFPSKASVNTATQAITTA